MAEPPFKKRRGGIKQRMAASSRECMPEDSQMTKSYLADHLLEKWAWGQRSPQEVQQEAQMACRDIECLGGTPARDLVFLASLGTSGQYSNKMHKELLAWANKRCKQMVLPYFVKMDFKEPYKKQLQSMLLPHEIFSCLYHEYKETWKQIILPSSAKLKEFWELQTSHPAYSTMASVADFDKKMVPIAFHGDGTPVIGIGKIWSRQLTIFSMNSLLGLGSTKQMQVHIWSCFDETMSDQTLPQFFRILGWSLSWLQLGQWPDRDHNGKLYSASSKQGLRALTPLADGFCGTVWSLVGDWEYLSAVLKLPHYSSKANPCSLCKCTGGSEGTSWKDCRPTAAWMDLQWTPKE